MGTTQPESQAFQNRHRHVQRVAFWWHMLSLPNTSASERSTTGCRTRRCQIRTVNQFDFFDSNPILC